MLEDLRRKQAKALETALVGQFGFVERFVRREQRRG